ncbi:hypothetical protein T4D_1594 [Trichinella pseudospiralis]|nr:hypothetical protein T4D_1594 [Trichinella pseudospiralis]
MPLGVSIWSAEPELQARMDSAFPTSMKTRPSPSNQYPRYQNGPYGAQFDGFSNCNGLPFFLIIASGTTHNEKDQALL